MMLVSMVLPRRIGDGPPAHTGLNFLQGFSDGKIRAFGHVAMLAAKMDDLGSVGDDFLGPGTVRRGPTSKPGRRLVDRARRCGGQDRTLYVPKKIGAVRIHCRNYPGIRAADADDLERQFAVWLFAA